MIPSKTPPSVTINIVIYLILALLLYAAAIILGTFASRNANTNLVAAISNAVGYSSAHGFAYPYAQNL